MIKKLYPILATLALSQCTESSIVSQDNKAFAQTISQKGIQLVDARSAEEYAAAHIPEAQNMDVMSKDFDALAANLSKDQAVAVYCKSGKRSKIAAGKLESMGYQVYNLSRGFNQWDGAVVK